MIDFDHLTNPGTGSKPVRGGDGLTVLPGDDAVAVRRIPAAAGTLPLAVIEPAGAKRTCVVAMGHAARLDEFELQRFRLLARELRSRLVVVETPGHGAPGTHLTAQERHALLTRSDFGPVAERMLDSAIAADPSIVTGPVAVLGYSLGASIGTAIAGLLRERTGSPVAALVLVEPVAGRPWRAVDLLRATRSEDRCVDDALAQNVEIAGAVEPWDRRPRATAPRYNRIDLLLCANALRAGRLSLQVVGTEARQVVIVRGKDSRLALPVAVGDVIREARTAGQSVDQLVILGTHTLWHALPSVRILGQFVADVLDRRA